MTDQGTFVIVGAGLAGAKAAQHNWSVNLARQLGGQGVTVNNLAPGVIATARNRACSTW